MAEDAELKDASEDSQDESEQREKSSSDELIESLKQQHETDQATIASLRNEVEQARKERDGANNKANQLSNDCEQLRDEKTQLEKKISALEDDKVSLSNDIALLEGEKSTLQSQIEGNNAEINKLKDKNQALSETIESTQSKYDKLLESNSVLQSEYDSLNSDYNSLANAKIESVTEPISKYVQRVIDSTVKMIETREQTLTTSFDEHAKSKIDSMREVGVSLVEQSSSKSEASNQKLCESLDDLQRLNDTFKSHLGIMDVLNATLDTNRQSIVMSDNKQIAGYEKFMDELPKYFSTITASIISVKQYIYSAVVDWANEASQVASQETEFAEQITNLNEKLESSSDKIEQITKLYKSVEVLEDSLNTALSLENSIVSKIPQLNKLEEFLTDKNELADKQLKTLQMKYVEETLKDAYDVYSNETSKKKIAF